MDNQTEQRGMHLETTVADDATPLCPKCLEPCDPKDYYCQNCGSNEAMNPLAPYMPLESIRFETGVIGKLWRHTSSPQTKLIDRGISLMLLILFYPLFLVVALSVMICQKCNPPKESKNLSNHE